MSRSRADLLLNLALGVSGAASAAILFLVIGYVTRESLPALDAVGSLGFLGDPSWAPTEGRFGVSAMIAGSLLASALALALAAGFGLGAVAFLTFVAGKPAAKAFRVLLQLLSGIPSVVFGFWGLTRLVPWLAERHPPGASLLTGALVLSLMILPTFTLIAESSVRQALQALGPGAVALGLSRWTSFWRLALPAARSGILAGLTLAAGRALGETMAVLMVAGNVVQLPSSVFDPVRTLTANIALEMAYAVDLHRSALFASGLVLILLLLSLLLTSELLRSRYAAR